MEFLKLVRGDGLDLLRDRPLNTRVTAWRGQGTTVAPELFDDSGALKIGHVDGGPSCSRNTVGINKTCGNGCATRGEHLVDEGVGLRVGIAIGVSGVEEDSEDGVVGTVGAALLGRDKMHLEIVVLAVDGMLRRGVNMSLDWVQGVRNGAGGWRDGHRGAGDPGGGRERSQPRGMSVYVGGGE